LETVLPTLEIGEDRNVRRRERILAGAELVAELPDIDELSDLRFANDQLRAVLDLLVVVGKAKRQRVARVIGPLDDVDELLLDEVEDRHGRLLLTQLLARSER